MPTETSAPAASPSALDPLRRRKALKTLRLAALVGLCLAVLIVVTGLARRAIETSQTKSWTSAQAIPAVNVIAPTAASGGQTLVLPGNLQAYYNAPIYARVAGYVHAWYVDIGARVKSGQLLATIDTPELDQQLIQARADLTTAEANMRLADTTAKRWTNLLAQDAVSKQESDEKTGDLAAKTAEVNAAKANVDRLLALKSFSRLVAPFDGVVTARKTDIGALVNAGAGGAANSELFDVAKVDKLRLYVRVPQNYASQIRPGLTATLTVPEYPGRSFHATLDTTSNAVSDNSGTLLVELLVDNDQHGLSAGDYAQVTFDLPPATDAGATMVRLPSSALLFRKSGTEVAVVGPGDHVRIQPVTVGRDLGAAIEVTSGLSPSDRVVDNPPDSIANGELVRIVRPGGERPSGDANASG